MQTSSFFFHSGLFESTTDPSILDQTNPSKGHLFPRPLGCRLRVVFCNLLHLGYWFLLVLAATYPLSWHLPLLRACTSAAPRGAPHFRQKWESALGRLVDSSTRAKKKHGRVPNPRRRFWSRYPFLGEPKGQRRFILGGGKITSKNGRVPSAAVPLVWLVLNGQPKGKPSFWGEGSPEKRKSSEYGMVRLHT